MRGGIYGVRSSEIYEGAMFYALSRLEGQFCIVYFRTLAVIKRE